MVGFIHLSTVHHHIDRWLAMHPEGALRCMPSPATQENILAESVGMIPTPGSDSARRSSSSSLPWWVGAAALAELWSDVGK